MPATAPTMLTVLTRRVCCYLRWRPAEEGEPASRVPHAAEGDFVCTHTLERFGPDARVADEESCREGRACYDLPGQPPRPDERAAGASRADESTQGAARRGRSAEGDEAPRRAGRPRRSRAAVVESTRR
jgi:hypothetical protein